MSTIYHVGAYKRHNTVVIQVVKDKDCLSCELVEYFGERQTTKRHLREYKASFLAAIREEIPYFKNCTKIVIQ
jgi:hypothetical protein